MDYCISNGTLCNCKTVASDIDDLHASTIKVAFMGHHIAYKNQLIYMYMYVLFACSGSARPAVSNNHTAVR